MTIGAYTPLPRRMGASGGDREKVVVIPRRLQPGVGRVAKLAICGKSRCRVIRVVRGAVIREVAPDACAHGSGVHPVEVAGSARCGRVHTGQLEWRAAMVECRWPPGSRRVAPRAGRWQAGRMSGVCRCNVLRLVAAETLQREAHILTVRMAVRARTRNMRTGEGEHGPAVIKCCRAPGRGRVAQRALRGEERADVSGIRGRSIIRRVASITCDRSACVHTGGMTVAALERDVGPCELEDCRAVVERRWCPCGGGVTSGASRREPR